MKNRTNLKPGMIRNIISTIRGNWLARLTDQKRDFDSEFGHPVAITVEDYWNKFERGDIAARVVSIYPEECFSEAPLIYETEDEDETDFEKEWNNLNETLRLTSMFLRADTLSGVGRFGVILLGIDDGLDLRAPVAGVDVPLPLPGPPETPAPPTPSAKPARKLLYVRTFDENLVTIKTLERDPRNPRFGLPVLYEITFWADAADQLAPTGLPTPSGIDQAPGGVGSVRTTFEVHWTRIIHLADNRLRDDVFGTPRMKKVWNRLLDLHKIVGGSAEMFWKGAFPGLALETNDSDEPVTIDKDATKKEIEDYQEGLKRYLALEGMTAKSLAPQAVDPGPHAEIQIRLISMALACPWRVFMGAEVGALASGQDIVAWNTRLNKRREEYLSPHVIRPVIDRLISMGVLPFPSGGPDAPDSNGRPVYIVFWNDLNTPSTAEQADVAVKRTDAMTKYVSGGVDQLIDPGHFLELVVGFSKDETDSILEEVGDRLVETDPEAEHQQALDKIAATAAAKGTMVAPPPGRSNPALNAENRTERFGWEPEEVEITPAPILEEEE